MLTIKAEKEYKLSEWKKSKTEHGGTSRFNDNGDEIACIYSCEVNDNLVWNWFIKIPFKEYAALKKIKNYNPNISYFDMVPDKYKISKIEELRFIDNRLIEIGYELTDRVFYNIMGYK